MSRGFDILKENGVNITKEEYLELEKKLEEKIASGFSTSDFLVNEIISKYFSGYFSSDKVKDFLYENTDFYVDALNKCFGFLLPVASKCSNAYCSEFVYSDYFGHFRGNAKLLDNSDVYLDIIICDIADKNSKPVVKSVTCIVYGDKQYENLLDVRFVFLTDNGGTYVGELGDILEK